MALRIRARAIRRCGELLRKIEPATGAHRKSTGGGTFSRKQAATEAGLSKRQKDTALRVANVPEDEFEAAVEGGSPATVKRLAEKGKIPVMGKMYHGIDRCDRCGQPLEQGQWLVGLCQSCEQVQKAPKRPVETMKPTKALVS